ncbi:MAG: L-glutamate gamma-semialdehyde dehydrogenase [Nitrospirae bacterium]|nr:L-glutamate gamma-semialdehyde dehydrogenase [Nitrospirota bacterium]
MNNNRENRIRDIGQEIYTHAISDTPSAFDKKRWEGRILEWAMKDESFKTQLFRYVDVFPSLKSDASVMRLFKEYFSDYNEDAFNSFGGVFKAGIRHIPETGLMSRLTAKVIRSNIKHIAGQFITGNNPQEAVPVIEGIRNNGYGFSIYMLGETVVSDKEAEAYVEGYLRLLDTLPQLNISIKLSSLYSQLDPVDWEGSVIGVKNNLRTILRKALQHNVPVTFDMEHHYYKDLLITIFKNILEENEFKNYNLAGIAIQAYLKDSIEDIYSLLNWARENGRVITVRLVKGAYWDYELVSSDRNGWPVPVFLNKEETDYNFEDLTRILLENTDVIRPAIATHNIRSIANAIAVAEGLGLSSDAFECQMLYGMAEPIRNIVKNMGYRVRVYTPVGEMIPGMAYLVRRLLENTSNESFLRRSFVEGVSFEELIAPPNPLPQAERDGDSPPFKGRGRVGMGFCSDKPFTNTPLTDFSKRENREKMRTSLQKVRGEFNRKYPLIIGGNDVWTDVEIISLNPAAPEEVVGTVSSAEPTDADRAVEIAKDARIKWRNVPPEERASILLKVAERLEKERFDLSALEIYEVGKTWQEADADIAETIDYMKYYGSEILRLNSGSLGDFAGETNEYIYKPKGIGVVISPWNFPLAIPAGMATAGIVAGNCVILKPSGLSPVIGYRLVEIFNTAGLPEGVFQFLPGSGQVIGEHLVKHPDIDFIAFTGSKEVGLKIIESAGKTGSGQKNIKRVIAELGGKNAIIIDETADIDEAITGVLESAFGFQGQKCSACSRVIVIEGIYDAFLKRFRDAVSSIKIGPAELPCNFMGPVIDRNAHRKISEYVETGKREGSIFISHPEIEITGMGIAEYGQGDSYTKESGNFISPAIFTDLSPDAQVAREEIFGPVVCVLKACDIDDAIMIANSTEYALTGGIFSRSPVNITKAREGFSVGNLYINRGITGALVGRQPFGGFRMSGIGSKAGGPDYLLQFMNPVCISENTLRKGFVPG